MITATDFRQYERGDKKAGARVDAHVKQLLATDKTKTYTQHLRDARIRAFASEEAAPVAAPSPAPQRVATTHQLAGAPTLADFRAYERGNKVAGGRIDAHVKRLAAADPSKNYSAHYREARVAAAAADAAPVAPAAPSAYDVHAKKIGRLQAEMPEARRSAPVATSTPVQAQVETPRSSIASAVIEAGVQEAVKEVVRQKVKASFVGAERLYQLVAPFADCRVSSAMLDPSLGDQLEAAAAGVDSSDSGKLASLRKEVALTANAIRNNGQGLGLRYILKALDPEAEFFVSEQKSRRSA